MTWEQKKRRLSHFPRPSERIESQTNEFTLITPNVMWGFAKPGGLREAAAWTTSILAGYVSAELRTVLWSRQISPTGMGALQIGFNYREPCHLGGNGRDGGPVSGNIDQTLTDRDRHHHVRGSHSRPLHPRPPPRAERETRPGMYQVATDSCSSHSLRHIVGIRGERTLINPRRLKRGSEI